MAEYRSLYAVSPCGESCAVAESWWARRFNPDGLDDRTEGQGGGSSVVWRVDSEIVDESGFATEHGERDHHSLVRGECLSGEVVQVVWIDGVDVIDAHGGLSLDGGFDRSDEAIDVSLALLP